MDDDHIFQGEGGDVDDTDEDDMFQGEGGDVDDADEDDMFQGDGGDVDDTDKDDMFQGEGGDMDDTDEDPNEIHEDWRGTQGTFVYPFGYPIDSLEIDNQVYTKTSNFSSGIRHEKTDPVQPY